MIFFEHATFFIFGLAFSHMYEKNWYFRCCYNNVSIQLWEFYEKRNEFSQKAMDIFFILSDKKNSLFLYIQHKNNKKYNVIWFARLFILHVIK